jgi:acyl dehydratase
MPLDAGKLRSWPLPEVRQSYSERDSILYAIGIGASIDAASCGNMDYLFEGHGPKTLPTMATVIGQRAMWMDAPGLGIDWRKIVHGEQKLTIHRPLPAAAEIVSDERVTDIYDKGDKGAVVWVERTIHSADRATHYSTLETSYFCRGDGGFGGDPGPAISSLIPDRGPDGLIDMPTRRDQAIIYRLSGDVNPLHVDDEFAKKVGFPTPILHGLCSYGIAARALIALLCDDDSTRLEHIAVRFSAPCYPGETIRTEYWNLDDGRAAFRCKAVERDVIILNHGEARIRRPAR